MKPNEKIHIIKFPYESVVLNFRNIRISKHIRAINLRLKFLNLNLITYCLNL